MASQTSRINPNHGLEKCVEKTPAFHIVPVRSEDDLKVTKELFYEYTTWLDIDLNFQSFATEMATFPGKYTPPTGELFLARRTQGYPIGCVALRALSGDACEMKRLFVKDSAKGMGVGKALVQTIIAAAKNLGYRSMRLDTLSNMTAALKLYRSLGFIEIAAYYETPMLDTVFLELDLVPRSGENI